MHDDSDAQSGESTQSGERDDSEGTIRTGDLLETLSHSRPITVDYSFGKQGRRFRLPSKSVQLEPRFTGSPA